MAIFNGRNWTLADFQPFNYVKVWDAFWNDVLIDLGLRKQAIDEAVTTATEAAEATAEARLVVAADKATAQAAAAVATATANTAVWCGTAGGTSNAITLTPAIAIGALYDGLTIAFLAVAPNTAAVTVTLPGIPAAPLRDPKGAILPAKALSSGLLMTATCTGGVFRQSGGGGGANLAAIHAALFSF